uniref:C2H2-type domain-containing protein n=1 Tax=viral metagenome TaxID=1070528 RepID=A0A6C0H3U6_9ZZZZ
MTYDILPKNAKIFCCEKCAFNTSNKFNYLKHLDTRKHKILTNTYQNLAKNATPLYECLCGKKYKHKQSLYAHKKVCMRSAKLCAQSVENSNIENNNIDLKELVCKMMTENNEIKNMLLKENQELRSQISELIPKVGMNNNTITNSSVTNSSVTNNKFNIQIFLNEQCKDAINMKDFIESIKISLQQLDLIQSKGLVEGLTNAILENISKLSLYKRPIHCTDIKRETLYIKHDDIWEKDKTKESIKKAIKELCHKPYYTLKEWLDNNPNYMDDEQKQHFFIQTTRSLGKKCDTFHDKVIKNICFNTYIKDV